MSYDRIVQGKRVLLEGQFQPASILVSRGKIVAIEPFGKGPDNVPLDDAGDAYVIPGLVDSHVHINEPGRTEWEGFRTATRAAAKAGVTTLVDMPLNSIPATTSLKALEEKRAAAQNQLWVDVGFWGGVIPGNTGELAAMKQAGICGFKCFLSPSGVDEFPHITEPDLIPAMEQLASEPHPLLVHAELPGPLAEAEAQHRDASPVRYLSYLASRPARAEDEAVAMMIRLAEQTGARVHIVHHASASGLPLLHAAKDNHLPVTAETCPHYLHFRAEEIPDGHTAFKCAPPIREASHQEELWLATENGTLDMIVSDHSPCTPELKRMEDGDFLEAWGGIASLQLAFAIAWTGVRRRGASLANLVERMSATPAELAGLSDKGAIAVGKDADIVFFHPDEQFSVLPEDLEHKHPVTPYKDQKLFGAVAATYLRGKPIYQNGALIESPTGKTVKRL